MIQHNFIRIVNNIDFPELLYLRQNYIYLLSLTLLTRLNDDQERSYDRLVRPLIEKKGRKAPSFEDLKFNASLVLGNSHVSLGEATGTPQSYKPIAGYHIEEVVKPLPAVRTVKIFKLKQFAVCK